MKNIETIESNDKAIPEVTPEGDAVERYVVLPEFTDHAIDRGKQVAEVLRKLRNKI